MKWTCQKSGSRLANGMKSPAIAPRTPEPGEFMPPDYFKRYENGDIFDADQPLEIDLGCGDGSFIVGMAEQHPDRNFLGVERLLGRVRKVSKQADRRGLANLKVLRLESRYTIEWIMAPESVSRIHLLCPDPWPKARHHRRRLIQTEFLDAVMQVLKPGGEFLFKTDHDEYFEWAKEIVEEHGKFEMLEWPEDAFFYPKTDFQILWESEGKTLQRLRLRKPD